MKRITHYLTAGLVVAAVSLIAVACGSGSTSAADTLTQAQFDGLLKTSSLYTALTDQLAANEATAKNYNERLSKLRVQVAATPPSATSALRTQSVSTQDTVNSGSTVLGTFEGYFTSDGYGVLHPAMRPSAEGMAILTAQNYAIYVTLYGTTLAATNYIFFTTTDCSGTPYDSYLSETGLVFRIGSENNPASYWAIQPIGGPESAQQITAYSYYFGSLQTPECLPIADGLTVKAYAAVPNATSITGAMSANVGVLSQVGG